MHEAILSAEAEHRLRELEYARAAGDPEHEWRARERLNGGWTVGLGGVGHALKTVAVAVVGWVLR